MGSVGDFISDTVGSIIPSFGKMNKAAEQAERQAETQRVALKAAENKQAAALAIEQKKLDEQQSRSNRARRSGGMFDSGSEATQVVTVQNEKLG